MHVSLLGFNPCFHIGVFHLGKKYLPVSERVEICITTTVFKYSNRMYNHIIIIKYSYKRYNTISQRTLDIPLQKTNTGQRALSFLGPKIWTKISHSTNNVKTRASFTSNLKREFLSSLFL